MFEFGINGADYGTYKTNWLQDWPEKTQIYWESRGTLAEKARNFFFPVQPFVSTETEQYMWVRIAWNDLNDWYQIPSQSSIMSGWNTSYDIKS